MSIMIKNNQTINIEAEAEEFNIIWITDKFANFTKGKTYPAHCGGSRIYTKKFTDFHITDDEHDKYSLKAKDLGKKFIIPDNEVSSKNITLIIKTFDHNRETKHTNVTETHFDPITKKEIKISITKKED